MLNYLIIITYLIVGFFYFTKRPAIIFFIPYIFSWFSSMISLNLIEQGEFISEQGRYGFNNGSFFIMSFFSFSSLIIYYFLSPSFTSIRIVKKQKRLQFFFVSVIFLLIILYAFFINNESNRFNFFSIFETYERFGNYLSIIFIATFFYASLKEPIFSTRLLYLLVAILLQFLKKSEFSGQLNIIFMYTMSEINHSNFKISLNKAIKLLSCFIVLLSILLVYKYYFYDNNFLNFKNRIVLQSHLFWGVLNNTEHQDLFTFSYKFFNQIININPGNPSAAYGLGELMSNQAPEIAPKFLESQVYFSGGYPAILIYYFGVPIAFLIHILCTILLAKSIQFLLILANTNILFFIFFYKLLTLSIFNLYSNGELFTFNGNLTIGLIFFLLCFFIFRNQQVITTIKS
jgi:hypothetical protein